MPLTKEQIADYIKNLIQPLAPQVAVEIKSDDLCTLFFIVVPEEDKGRIIGRSGETMRCIRHIVSLVGYQNSIRASVKVT